MSMIEFQTYIQHGTIAVPWPYRESLTGRVRVILLLDDDTDEGDMIDQLLDHPYHIVNFIPFTRDEIYERT